MTVYKRLTIIIICILSLGCGKALSKDFELGLFNSPKGFGLSSEIFRHGLQDFYTINIYADMYGVFSGKNEYPGIKFQGFCEKIVFNKSISSCQCQFHTGPGIALGYVNDYSKEHFNSPGIEAGLAGNAGFKFLFQRGLSLDLSFSFELGVFIHLEKGKYDTAVNIYKNGGLQLPYPQLTLFYNF